MSHKIDLDLLPEPPNNIEHYKDIVRKPYHQLSYNEFFWNYMKTNWPLIITDISNDWDCSQNWLQQTSEGRDDNDFKSPKIDFNYLKEKIGNVTVPIVNCDKAYFNSHEKKEVQFFEFLDYWERVRKSLPDEKQNFNSAKNLNVDDKLCNSQATFYLKDWHLQAKMPNYSFYKVPIHFGSDWLNEYLLDTNRDDYRFVYMGPKDSWTPFHADVFGSFSWSTNIAGVKKWIILPPGEELKLADRLGNLPFRIFEKELEEKEIKFFTILQKENEAFFVPSGWYHQVWNMTDTISVNHNWFNGCIINKIWENLASNMEKVIKEIEDCRQMDNYESHCQTMLKATFGMNFSDFLDLLEFIVEKRLRYCNGNVIRTPMSESSENIFLNCFQPNYTQIQFDLRSLNEVSQIMLKNKIVYDDRSGLYKRCLKIQDLTKNHLSLE